MIEKTGHVPVLLNEVMNVLEPKPMKTYIDATFGNGGYSRKILETLDCKVIAIDRDPLAINQANKFKDEYQERFEFFNYKFSQLDNLLESLGTKNIDGFVFDLGVSSMQIDNQDRGFSFQNDGKLDMRMSQDGLTAEEIINEYKNNTEEALSRNVWGSPTFIYNNELFWGQDRIDFLERAIQNN